MENLHLVDGGDITHCNMFAELCAEAGYRCGLQLKSRMYFLFLSLLKQRCAGRDVGGLACTHAHMYICAVLSAGCAVIQSVTVNTYCEKEKELPKCVVLEACSSTFVKG